MNALPPGRLLSFSMSLPQAFLGLLVGYWRLQIGQHRQYLDLAERNRIRNLPVIAPRGRILDRDGRVLADNFPAFSVLSVARVGRRPSRRSASQESRGDCNWTPRNSAAP